MKNLCLLNPQAQMLVNSGLCIQHLPHVRELFSSTGNELVFKTVEAVLLLIELCCKALSDMYCCEKTLSQNSQTPRNSATSALMEP